MKAFTRCKVISKEMLADGIVSLWAEAPFAAEAHAGQFVSFYTDDPSRLLPRPISICDINRRLSALRFVFRIAGEGTRQLSLLRTGDETDVLGPLGNGFPLQEAAGKRVLLCGGGIGIPPMLSCVRDLYDEPCAGETGSAENALRFPLAVSAALGYRHDTFLLEEFKESCGVYIATEDGSTGVRGTVLDAIRSCTKPVDLIFACGPLPMLRAVASYARENGIPAYVSMEERMACGVGACLACTCRVKEEDPHYHTNRQRICTDGPVFPADLLEELW